jgi:hypothetical protein
MEQKTEQKMEQELDKIQEDNPLADGVASAAAVAIIRPPSTDPSVASATESTEGGSKTATKRRTWKKPKDKPKRPLSAYNLFFKHERFRIVDGKTDDPSAEEIVRAIENILATSRETRRHRKTHGRISFGDLARKIADKWKNIGTEQKAVFDHYAELDMRRYRKEVKIWKDKKENEALIAQRSGSLSESQHSMHSSFSSVDSGDSEYSESGEAWNPRKNFSESMNSSFSSCGSVDSEYSLEPIPIDRMIQNASHGSMHASMPNITSMGGYASMQYGQQSLSSVHGDAPMSANFQQQHQHQPHGMSILNMQQRFQGGNGPGMDPVPFEQVFPDAAQSGGNSSKDLEDFLSHLDLSNV